MGFYVMCAGTLAITGTMVFVPSVLPDSYMNHAKTDHTCKMYWIALIQFLLGLLGNFNMLSDAASRLESNYLYSCRTSLRDVQWAFQCCHCRFLWVINVFEWDKSDVLRALRVKTCRKQNTFFSRPMSYTLISIYTSCKYNLCRTA